MGNEHRIPPRGLIVSCQALGDEPLHGSEHMVVMMKAAIIGGAVAIRANGPDDIRAIRNETQIPIIGLDKICISGFDTYITPTFEAAKTVAEAGADIIAIDATSRPRPDGLTLEETISKIHRDLGLYVMADISTVEEGVNAVKAGADVVSTTLAGYTPWSRDLEGPDFLLLKELLRKVDVPVILEGRVWTPEEAAQAIKLGAYGVVVGSAITRPQLITKRFAKAIANELFYEKHGYTVGIDIGGTSIKAGIVDSKGSIYGKSKVPTNAAGGAKVIAASLKQCLTMLQELYPEVEPRSIGVASAGQIDSDTGIVVSSTPNLPGWHGVNIPELVRKCCNYKDIPVVADNDANAAAYGEYLCGAGRGCRDIVCITIGTGVGGGIISDGNLIRGALGAGGELGHISIDPNGPKCNCGNYGCIEAYISGWALAKRLGDGREAVELFDAAARGQEDELKIMKEIGRYLGYGLVNIVNIFQPQRIILGGSIGSRAELFLDDAVEVLKARALTGGNGHPEVVVAALGNEAGIIGAGMMAWGR